MIDKTIMYGCHCDNCGEHWIDEEEGIAVFGDENGILNEVRNFESWHTEGPFGNEKHYCPDCFKINDEDELVIDMTRTKPLEWEPKNGVPRRMRLDLLTPNELLVFNVGQEVEKMGADVLLTDAVILLQQVREKLADYVEANCLLAAVFCLGAKTKTMELNWDNAKVWQEKANEKKEIFDEPKWEWDCNFKLDFDGSLLRISSRFYPPHKNAGNWWEGNVLVNFLGDELLRKEFKCITLDELKTEVEKFTKHYADAIKARLS